MYNFLCSLLFAVLTYDLPPELWDKNMVQLAPAQLGTDIWLQMWLSSLITDSSREIAFTARGVCTPRSASAWHAMLTGHQNTPLVQFVIQGICQGFRIGFTRLPGSLKSANKNLEGAQQRSDVVNVYLSSELATGHVVGPFLHRQSRTCTLAGLE